MEDADIKKEDKKHVPSLQDLTKNNLVKTIANQFASKKTDLQDMVLFLSKIPEEDDKFFVVGKLVLNNEQLSWEDKIALTQALQPKQSAKFFELIKKQQRGEFDQSNKEQYEKLNNRANLLEFFEEIMVCNKDGALQGNKKFPQGVGTVVSSSFDRSPQSLLCLAVELGNIFTVKFLLQEGVLPNEKYCLRRCFGEWWPPILFSASDVAIERGDIGIIKALIAAGFKVTDRHRTQVVEAYNDIKNFIKTMQTKGVDINEPVEHKGMQMSLAYAEAAKEKAKNILHVLGITDIED